MHSCDGQLLFPLKDEGKRLNKIEPTSVLAFAEAHVAQWTALRAKLDGWRKHL